jgi:hypothetical protein
MTHCRSCTRFIQIRMGPEVDAFARGLADDVASTLSTAARRSPPNAFANFWRSPEHADRGTENIPLRVDVSDIPWVKDAVAAERASRLAEIKMIVSKTLKAKFPTAIRSDPGEGDGRKRLRGIRSYPDGEDLCRSRRDLESLTR